MLAAQIETTDTILTSTWSDTMRRYYLLAAFVLAAATSTGNAQVMSYDNTTNFGGQFFSNGQAALIGTNTITQLVADHIHGNLAGPATLVVFSVSNNNPAIVSARPRVRFYDDDGAGGGPGTLLTGFSFAPIAFPANGLQLFNFNPGGGLIIPADGAFWAGITFDDNSGGTGATLAQMNNLGQLDFDPPTVGFSEDNYFQTNAAGSFFAANPAGTIQNFGGVPIANFGWQFQVVPEPGSMTLAGFAVMGGIWRLRRKIA